MKNLLSVDLKRFLSYFLSCLILFQTTACMYFKVIDSNPEEVSEILNDNQINKNFIIHSGENTMLISEMAIDFIHLSGLISEINEHVYYENGRRYRYKKFEKSIINEIHIYLKSSRVLSLGQHQIPLEDINEIRIINKNTGKTIAYVSIGILVYVGAVILALANLKLDFDFD